MVRMKLHEYIGASLIAALPAIALALNHNIPEPQLRPTSNPNAMVWSYPGEFQARNFYDARPFGSLDEVVYRTHDRQVFTLRPSDKDFARQESVYQDKIAPLIRGEAK